jgi:hypothetical protein
MPDDLESLRVEVQKIRSALGALCVTPNGSHHTVRPKLETVDPNTPEAFYMLAAFCLDLSRKLDYIFLVMRGFAEETDSAFARRLLNDNQEVYSSRDSWETAARDTERVFLRLLREIHEEHRRLLERLAG